jgi:hypothetical protein
MVEHRIASNRGDDAGRNPQHQRKHDRAQRELDGRREQREEFVQHGRLRDHRLAEIAMQHATDVDAVLHHERPVEAVFLEQLCVPRGVDAALARHRFDRVARHQPNEEEREQRHPDERRNDKAQTGGEKAKHGLSSI